MVAPRIDTILELKDHIAANVALVSGQFEDEIKKFEQVKKQAEDRLKKANALETFDKIKADVDAYKAKKMAEIDDAAQALKDFEASLKSKEAALADNLKNYYDERKSHLDSIEKQTAELGVEINKIASAKALADDMLFKAKDAALAVSQREAAVAAREAEVQRKMDVLKNL